MAWPILVLDKFGCCFLDSGDIWRMKSNLGMAHYGTERVQGVQSMRAYMSFLGNLRDGPLWFWTPRLKCCSLQPESLHSRLLRKCICTAVLHEWLRNYGPFHSFWLFSFEPYNGHLWSFLTNNRAIEMRFVKRPVRSLWAS